VMSNIGTFNELMNKHEVQFSQKFTRDFVTTSKLSHRVGSNWASCLS
jgi:hypothetical protein